MTTTHLSEYRYGISINLAQFSHQLVQVFFVGLTIGMFRTVVPALAESEFGVAKNSFMMLISLRHGLRLRQGHAQLRCRAAVRAHRPKKCIVPRLAGSGADPLHDPVCAVVELDRGGDSAVGSEPGLTWSMTQTAKLDLTTAEQRGLTIGVNEFSGYFGVAVAGIITAYLATAFGPRRGS